MTNVINSFLRFALSVWKELNRSYPKARSTVSPLTLLPSTLSRLLSLSFRSVSLLFLVFHGFFAPINNSGARDVVKTLTKVKAFKAGPAWILNSLCGSYDNNSQSPSTSSLSNDTRHLRSLTVRFFSHK